MKLNEYGRATIETLLKRGNMPQIDDDLQDEPILTPDQVREINRCAEAILNADGWGDINIKFQRRAVSDIRVSVNRHYQCYDEGGYNREMR